MTIKNKERKMVHEFSALECAKMFNIDCSPHKKVSGVKVRYIEAPYAMNDCNVPLWTIRKRSRVSKRVKPFADTIKAGVSEHEPGTAGRVADLAKFYATHMVENAEGNWELNKDVSAFEV